MKFRLACVGSLLSRPDAAGNRGHLASVVLAVDLAEDWTPALTGKVEASVGFGGVECDQNFFVGIITNEDPQVL